MCLILLLFVQATFAQPLLRLVDTEITQTITGSPDDDGSTSGCVVQGTSNPWVVQGFDLTFNTCTEACVFWAASIQKQTVKAAYEEGCTDPGPLSKFAQSEIKLTFEIINTLEDAGIAFPIGGTTMRSFLSSREKGVIEQENYIFLESPSGEKLAGNAYSHAKSSASTAIVNKHLEYLFPLDTLGSFPDPWEQDLTVSAGGLTGTVVLSMRADDFVEAVQFNDIAAVDEYPLYVGHGVSTARIQALVSVGALDGVSPSEPDADGDYWVDILDNCTVVENTDQRDPDNDGYGAVCDGDFDNDGIVGTSDQTILQDAMFSVEGDQNYDADVDMDGDGDIDSADVVIWRDYIGLPPGPSGRMP